MSTTVVSSCGAYRSVVIHAVNGPLPTLPVATPNVAGFQRLPSDPIGSAVLTLEANASLIGAEIRIYDLDELAVNNLGTELAGTESCAGSTFAYFYDFSYSPNVVWIQVMAPGYEEYGQRYTLPTRDTTLSVILQAELNT